MLFLACFDGVDSSVLVASACLAVDSCSSSIGSRSADSVLLQIYDAASHTASDAFLKLRANVSTADAYAALTATEGSGPDAPRRCPLPLEKIDQLLEGDNPDLFKPGALCRCDLAPWPPPLRCMHSQTEPAFGLCWLVHSA